MSLYEIAKQDIKNIVTNQNEWGKSIRFENPNTSMVVTVTGIHTKHHINIDGDGVPVNSQNAHITVSESSLTSLGYTVRNSRDEVSIVNHYVQVADANGNTIKYVISQTFPDETVGTILCILSSYAEN